MELQVLLDLKLVDTLPTFVTGPLLDHLPVDLELDSCEFRLNQVDIVGQLFDFVFDLGLVLLLTAFEHFPVLLELALPAHLLHGDMYVVALDVDHVGHLAELPMRLVAHVWLAHLSWHHHASWGHE